MYANCILSIETSAKYLPKFLPFHGHAESLHDMYYNYFQDKMRHKKLYSLLFKSLGSVRLLNTFSMEVPYAQNG